MRTNPKIKNLLAEIAESSTKYANTKDAKKVYYRKLLKFYRDNLSEDEQLFLFSSLMEQLSYKNIITDPENMLTVGNIKLRTHFMIFIMSTIFVTISAYLFGTNGELQQIGEVIGKLLTILGINPW